MHKPPGQGDQVLTTENSSQAGSLLRDVGFRYGWTTKTTTEPQDTCRYCYANRAHELSYFDKIPAHLSPSTGSSYVQDIIECGNPARIHHFFRMPLSTFQQLCDWMTQNNLLKPARYITVEEQLAIFLNIVGKSISNRDAQEVFQHSGSTISRSVQ